MAKETKKQIVAQTRNNVAKEYSRRIELLQERVSHLGNLLKEEQKKRIEYQDKAERLEEEINQYKDWNERLQSYMDMSEEDRKQALAADIARYNANKSLDSLLSRYSKFFNLF